MMYIVKYIFFLIVSNTIHNGLGSSKEFYNRYGLTASNGSCQTIYGPAAGTYLCFVRDKYDYPRKVKCAESCHSYKALTEEKLPLKKHTDLNVGTDEQSCRTIDGPGQGKPCIFPYVNEYGQVFTGCSLDLNNQIWRWWCPTEVYEDGRLDRDSWGACSCGCPFVTFEGPLVNECDTEEQGIKCTFPFSHMGHTYHGCLKRPRHSKYWCVAKDEMAEKGFRRVNCTESCPRDHILAEPDEELSPKEIVEKLKTNPHVISATTRGDPKKCEDYLASYNMHKVGQTS